MTTNLRGYLYGTALMAAVSATGLLLALTNVIGFWNYFLFAGTFLAGFVTARNVAMHRFWLALSQVGPVLVVVFVLFTIGFTFDTRWQNVGFLSIAMRTLLFAPLAIVLCAVGGWVGLKSARDATPNTSLERTRDR